ncbi:GNAT family N-acetyltransferase [Terriglobus albidus]|uniref:GNAT family N-acetyltransferase n=1 Tax=Terriglobus albidus TaxID=1592106 RepID=UPI0021DFAF36|nr:GNAT family N-acetyltransferase [Terriglobus albidus]
MRAYTHLQIIGASTVVMRAAENAVREIVASTGRPPVLIDESDSAFVCYEGNAVIGLAVVRWWADELLGYITLAWVHPDYRKQGIYKVLHGAVVVGCKAMGFKKIGAGVALCNDVSKLTHEALGMKQVAVMYEMEVPA